MSTEEEQKINKLSTLNSQLTDMNNRQASHIKKLNEDKGKRRCKFDEAIDAIGKLEHDLSEVIVSNKEFAKRHTSDVMEMGALNMKVNTLLDTIKIMAEDSGL